MKAIKASVAVVNPVGVWHTEHVYFGKLLKLLQRELDVFHRGERPNYELMQDIVGYLRDYSDRYHHPREDEAFRRLVRHSPRMALPLARLHQEHRVIAHAGEKLMELIDAILEDIVVPREGVEAALATYLVYYNNHIATEEAEVLSRAAAQLTAADWEAVKDAAPAGVDPLFGDLPTERFQELRRQIALQS